MSLGCRSPVYIPRNDAIDERVYVIKGMFRSCRRLMKLVTGGGGKRGRVTCIMSVGQVFILIAR